MRFAVIAKTRIDFSVALLFKATFSYLNVYKTCPFIASSSSSIGVWSREFEPPFLSLASARKLPSREREPVVKFRAPENTAGKKRPMDHSYA